MVELKNDILVISGGKDSHIFEYLKRNNISDTNKVIDQFTKYFKDDFILEVQRTNRPDEAEYFKNVLPLAINRGIPLVATNDVLFANQDDYEVHETKVCINTSKTLNDPNREKNFSEQQYFKSSKQMNDLFKDCDSLITIQMNLLKNAMFLLIQKNIFYQNIQYQNNITLIHILRSSPIIG